MKKIAFLFGSVTLFVIGFIVWFRAESAAVNLKDTSTKIFVVEKGEGLKSIAKSLKKEALIRDELIFLLTAKKLHIEGLVQAGDFRLSPSMDSETIAKTLTHGTIDRWVTIIEGWRAEEIAALFKKEISTYENGWITELKKHEGYLFPDTYLVPKDADINFVLSLFQNNFYAKVTKKMRDDLAKDGRTLNQAITLASIIEREAKFADDRPKVASVFLNRLSIGMKLDVDATVQYALGFQEMENSWWKKSLSNADLKFDSPFNTYLYNKLPPHPIASPGLSAIKASTYPEKTDYMYYLSDKKGHMHFVTTFEEHQENIKKYL